MFIKLENFDISSAVFPRKSLIMELNILFRPSFWIYVIL